MSCRKFVITLSTDFAIAIDEFRDHSSYATHDGTQSRRDKTLHGEIRFYRTSWKKRGFIWSSSHSPYTTPKNAQAIPLEIS